MKKTKHKISDGEILRQSLSRPWMFSMLVQKYQKPFLRKSIKVLHSKEAAEDAVQDTFLKIYKNAQKFSEKRNASFNSWAYKILLNTCYDEVARKKKANLETFEFADLDSIVPMQTEDTATVSYVQSVLQKMPKNLSHFLKLYFFEEKSQKEIAEEQGMTEVAVRSRIHRAKKYFKNIALQYI